MWDLDVGWNLGRAPSLADSCADADRVRGFHLYPPAPPSNDVTGEGSRALRRCVVLERPPNGGPLGFSIRAPRNGDPGVLVSRVAVGSEAHKAGLWPGDRIFSANGIFFWNIPHENILEILCTQKRLNLTVLTSGVPRNYLSSLKSVPSKYAWVDRYGRPTSPPNNWFLARKMAASPLSRTPSYREVKEAGTFKKMVVIVEKGMNLGLVIRGGAEYGLGIYITGVDEASAADLAGLQVGDQILSVNDNDFTSITHDDAVELLQTSPRMTMVVRSVGKIPHYTTHSTYDSGGGGGGGTPWYSERNSFKRHGSPLEVANGIPGDNRMSRKGSSRKRDVSGDENPVASNKEKSEFRLDKKSKKVLTESQRISLAYYCNEYETGSMSVDAFVAVLLEFLDTQEKYSLMTEIRGLVRDEDLDKFDELIYRREVQAMKSKEAMFLSADIHGDCSDGLIVSSPKENIQSLSPRGSLRASTRRRQQQQQKSFQDVHHLTVPDAGDDMHTPSEDSGVDLANGTIYCIGSRKGSRVLTESRDSMLESQLQRKGTWRTTRNGPRRSFDAMSVLREATRMRRNMLRRHSSGGEGGSFEERRPFEDRRWSIGSEVPDTPALDGHLAATQAVLSRLESIALSRRRPSNSVPRSPILSPRSPLPISPSNLQIPHIRVRRHRSLPDPHAIYARKRQQQMEQQQQQRSASVRLPGHRTIPEADGRLRVIVKKTRPLLGIAIEGGSNTSQPLPRIISIHASGAAFEAGGLKVGHVILEVDGVKTNRKSHSEVAQVIAQAFYSKDRDQVEFLVTEGAKTELDIRRSSFMVFE